MNLEDCAIALHFLGRVLQAPPDMAFLENSRGIAEFFQGADAGLGVEAAPLEPPENPQALALFQAELAADHLRLFSGPAPLAPPWESVWRERDKLLFGETTLAIASIYEDWEMAIAEEGNAPQDHLGLELSFLAFLLDTAFYSSRLSKSGIRAADAARGLLNSHILKFAPEMLKTASECAYTGYYKSVCELCMETLLKLEKNIAEFNSPIPR